VKTFAKSLYGFYKNGTRNESADVSFFLEVMFLQFFLGQVKGNLGKFGGNLGKNGA